MKLLLDTGTFLNAVLDPERLSQRVRSLLLDRDNETYLSVVSSWEIAIKYSIRKLPLTVSPDQFIPEHRAKLGAQMLPLDEASVTHVPRLPHLHRDPFDRILVCQAIIHGMALVTSDARISQYPVRTVW